MRDQASRDEETLKIFTAMLIFALALGLGAGALALLRAAVDVPEGLELGLLAAVFALAAGLAVASLDSHRRRR